MPRVLFLSEAAHWWGGVATWLHALTLGLSERGWDVHVGLAHGRRFHRPDVYRKAHPHMQVVELAPRHLLPAARQEAVKAVLKRLQPQIVTPVNLFDALAATVQLKAAGMPVRLVTVHHGFQPLSIDNQKHCASWIDMAVSVNRLVARLLQTYVGVPSDRIRHLPSGCPTPEPQPTERTRQGGLRIGYVGRLEQSEKRILDAIQLVAELERLNTPYRLEFIGSGPCEDELRRALIGPVAAGRVVFRGYLDRAELLSTVYPNLDCIMLFSPAEGSPTVLWEAMTQGVVPVIGRYLGCLAEGIVRHDQTGLLFEVGDMRAAAVALQRLAHDAALLGRLSTGLEPRSPARTRSRTARRLERGIRSGPRNAAGFGEKIPAVVRPRLPRLERLGIPVAIAAGLRSLLRRTPVAGCSGDEWPWAMPCDPDALHQINHLAHQLDRAEDGRTADRATTSGCARS
jgi:glycosyltransferase involved in cell wall biosynthesis